MQINAGQMDPLVPPPQSEALAKLLTERGASVKLALDRRLGMH